MTNRKLRQRAARLLEQATGASAASVRRALRQAGGNPGLALVILKTGVRTAGARRRWKQAAGNLRKALSEN